MKLENLTAEIRPRGKWESVDLGVALVQKNYKAIMLGWSLTVLPLMLILLGASYAWYSMDVFHFTKNSSTLYKELYAILPFLIFWWLKPIFEKVPLYVLSRALFGEKINYKELAQKWPKMIFKDAFKLLVLRRISMNRSFVMPIHELEGLRGSQYRQRVRLLSRNGGDGANSLCTACNLLAGISLFTILATYVMLASYGLSHEILEDGVSVLVDAFAGEVVDQHSVIPLMIFLVSYLSIITLLTPFYVGGGFGIYLNSRTISEGWDIELAFKRMSERIRGLSQKSQFFTLLLISIVSCSLFSNLEATVKNEDNEMIDAIMNSKDFDVEIKKTKVYEDENYNSPDLSDWSWGQFGTILFWSLAAIVLAVLIYYVIKNWHVFKSGQKVNLPKEATEPKARSVLGMDVTPESLPDDILNAAQTAWHEGDRQLALSLLYRGSLEWFVNKAHLPIRESDTESDCVRHASVIHDASITLYFEKLTDLWTALAYGKNQPEDHAIQWLVEDWPFVNNVQVIESEAIHEA